MWPQYMLQTRVMRKIKSKWEEVGTTQLNCYQCSWASSSPLLQTVLAYCLYPHYSHKDALGVASTVCTAKLWKMSQVHLCTHTSGLNWNSEQQQRLKLCLVCVHMPRNNDIPQKLIYLWISAHQMDKECYEKHAFYKSIIRQQFLDFETQHIC